MRASTWTKYELTHAHVVQTPKSRALLCNEYSARVLCNLNYAKTAVRECCARDSLRAHLERSRDQKAGARTVGQGQDQGQGRRASDGGQQGVQEEGGMSRGARASDHVLYMHSGVPWCSTW